MALALWQPPAHAIRARILERRYHKIRAAAAAGPFAAGLFSQTGYLKNTSPVSIDISTAFSFTCWIYRTTSGHSDAMLTRYYSQSGGNVGWMFWTNSDNLGLVTNAGNVNTTISVGTNAWHFVFIRGDGSNIEFSLDGGAETSKTYAQASVSLEVDVGAYRTTSVNQTSGYLDAMGFANSDLGSGARTTYYNGGTGYNYTTMGGTNQAQWESWWDFEEGAGLTRVDQKGHNNLTDNGSTPQSAGHT